MELQERKSMKALRKRVFVFAAFLMMMTMIPAMTGQAKKVRLNKKVLYVKLGKVRRLKMKGTKKRVRWKSTNPDVAKVYNGYVAAVNPGNATVIAKAGRYIRKCRIKVVSLDKASVVINKGGSSVVRVINGRNTRWASTNSKIVTVSDNGVIKGKKTGAAWIVCKSRGYKFRCLVYVAALNTEVLKLGKGGSFQMAVGYTDQPAAWFSRNPAVASVDEAGVVQGNGQGTTVIGCRTGEAVLLCKVRVIERVFTSISSLPDSTRGSKVEVNINQFTGTRKYTIFSQTGDNKSKVYPRYLPLHGCGATTTANILSGFASKVFTPAEIIERVELGVFGSAIYKSNYKKSPSDKRPVSLYGITRILARFGVRSTYVRKFTDAAAVAEIKSHLVTGNPVIIEVSSKNRYTKKNDKRWSNSKHTMALLGLTTDGRAIVADPANRSGFGDHQRIKYEFVENLIQYMFPCEGKDSTSCYYVSAKKCGGYILVNK